jgi:signal transduction histidine kinase
MTGEAPSVRPISVGSHRPHSMGGTIDTALRLERALDVVSDVFVLFDSDFRVVYHNEANRAAMRATGMDPDAAIGKDVLDAMPQLAGTVGHRESQRSMSERVSTEWEETYHPDLRLRGRAYPTADGGLMVVASNITAEWKALEAARAARVTAEDANRAKSDFLAAMSHELRTPLNAIGGYTELLTLGLRGPLTDEQKQDLRRISRNQEHLSTLINEVLSFARIEANHVEVVLGYVAVSEVLAGVEPIMAPQIAQKNLCFAIEDHSPALEMLADRDKVQQILVNLLANAVKFTPSGGSITLSVRDEDPRSVSIAVRDTGIGIPAHRIGDIFEPFVQVHRSLREPTSGTGLGLAISRDLARRMGADIVVASEEGVGSTFTLVVPRAP